LLIRQATMVVYISCAPDELEKQSLCQGNHLFALLFFTASHRQDPHSRALFHDETGSLTARIAIVNAQLRIPTKAAARQG
jgi:hypothetical protein